MSTTSAAVTAAAISELAHLQSITNQPMGVSTARYILASLNRGDIHEARVIFGTDGDKLHQYPEILDWCLRNLGCRMHGIIGCTDSCCASIREDAAHEAHMEAGKRAIHRQNGLRASIVAKVRAGGTCTWSQDERDLLVLMTSHWLKLLSNSTNEPTVAVVQRLQTSLAGDGTTQIMDGDERIIANMIGANEP